MPENISTEEASNFVLAKITAPNGNSIGMCYCFDLVSNLLNDASYALENPEKFGNPHYQIKRACLVREKQRPEEVASLRQLVQRWQTFNRAMAKVFEGSLGQVPELDKAKAAEMFALAYGYLSSKDPEGLNPGEAGASYCRGVIEKAAEVFGLDVERIQRGSWQEAAAVSKLGRVI